MSESKTIGPRELAERSGVSTDTLRHYERKRVLPAPVRTRAGYRRYSPDAVDRVAMIRRALMVGFTLDELARVLDERARGGAPCRKVYARVSDRLAAIDGEIAALQELKTELGDLLKNWKLRLDQTPAGQQARLLDTLKGPAKAGRYKSR